MNAKKYLFLALICFAGLRPPIAQAQQKNLFDNSFVHALSIRFAQNDWTYRLDSLRINGDEMIPAAVTIDGKTYADAGVRYLKDRSYTLGVQRNPLQIQLDYRNPQQNHQGRKNIKLLTAFHDPSLTREVLAAELAGKYFPTPKAAYVNLTINGDNRGIFINVEAVDSLFLIDNYGSADGSLFRSTGGINKDSLRDCNKDLGALLLQSDTICTQLFFQAYNNVDWHSLRALTQILKEDPEHAGSVINVDKILWQLAFNDLLVHLNSYTGLGSGNYYLYEDKPVHFVPIFGDLSESFGGFRKIDESKELSLKEMQELDPLFESDNLNKPLIAQLLKIDEYKKVYLSHIREMLDNEFANGAYKKRAEELQRMIQSYVYNAGNKMEFGGADFQKSLTASTSGKIFIPGIEELMVKRIAFLNAHPALAFKPPTVEKLEITRRDTLSQKKVADFKIFAIVLNFPKKVSIFYRSSAAEHYNKAEMFDEGTPENGKPGEKKYGIEINPQGKYKEIEFFFIAENIASVGYNPSNYMLKTNKANLDELNK